MLSYMYKTNDQFKANLFDLNKRSKGKLNVSGIIESAKSNQKERLVTAWSNLFHKALAKLWLQEPRSVAVRLSWASTKSKNARLLIFLNDKLLILKVKHSAFVYSFIASSM